jgi:hypothetical protein
MSTNDPRPLDDDDMTTRPAGGTGSGAGSGRDVDGSGDLDTQDQAGGMDGGDVADTDGVDSDSTDGVDSGSTDSDSSDHVDHAETPDGLTHADTGLPEGTVEGDFRRDRDHA